MSLPGAASATFTCETAELDNEIMVTVSGDLDSSAAGFRQHLFDAAVSGKPLFLDLTAVSFIDGTGFCAIHATAAAVPVTAATNSPLIATILQTAPGVTIRVQAS